MGEGIRDKIAILGMGCTKFGELWELGAEELLVGAFIECLKDAGVEKKDLDSCWFGTYFDDIGLGKAGMVVANTLKLPFLPVTRVENMCATGIEAFRAACYGVASGACKMALAIGVEKIKDTGYGGLPSASAPPFPQGQIKLLIGEDRTAPGDFAQLAIAYSHKYKIPMEKLKEAMAHVSWKSHQNGAMNPRAHLRMRVSKEQIINAPIIAYPLGLFDCCGVSDGCAAAVVTTPEIARTIKRNQEIITVKAIQVAVSSGEESWYTNWDGCSIITTQTAAHRAYIEAGIKNPRDEISMMEVHDCFSITELCTYEDLLLSPRGRAMEDILNGFYDLTGRIPCQTDGGLKCFGHPLGASGLRMIFEIYNQLLGRWPEERQVKNPRFGLAHNLGGAPASSVCGVVILGK
jgi:acetyl-CoA C-acetyltransferase